MPKEPVPTRFSPAGEPGALARAFLIQGEACGALGSPFYAALCPRLAVLAAAGGDFLDLFEPWAGASVGELANAGVPLRLLGALHDLVLAGDAPEFEGAFPGDADAVMRGLPALLARRRAAIAAFMTSPPQTNEVRRSICLLGGFLTVAKETGLPLRTFELGASAGLNLNWDRYAYGLGPSGAWGDLASPVSLTTRWGGIAPPLEAEVRVLSRAGVDRNPIDLRQPLAARRLQAYVWPDQSERLARLRAAIDLALATDVRVDKAEAADWTEAQVGVQEGAASVLYHSVVWQYLSDQTQSRIRAVVRRAAEAATSTAPFAWLRMEPDAALSRYELRLDLWPQAEERLLGLAHPHGAEVEWLDG